MQNLISIILKLQPSKTRRNVLFSQKGSLLLHRITYKHILYLGRDVGQSSRSRVPCQRRDEATALENTQLPITRHLRYKRDSISTLKSYRFFFCNNLLLANTCKHYLFSFSTQHPALSPAGQVHQHYASLFSNYIISSTFRFQHK